MKKITSYLTIIFAFISLLNARGQNYQTIDSRRIAYFADQNGQISCIRIDSVKAMQDDSIFYPFTVIQPVDIECFSPFYASWIGKYVTINTDGTNKFLNIRGETIIIKTNANPGDSWIAYTGNDSLMIKATVIKHDTLSFLGINDSVKTIEFQALDKNMNPIEKEINNMPLKISKNYGFVTMVNFYFFPDIEFCCGNWLKAFTLVGLSHPDLGINNLTWKDVNDFQVGDELHVITTKPFCNDWCYNPIREKTTKTIYKYLERTEYADTIAYRYSRKESIETIWTDSTNSTYHYDTLTMIVTSDSLFDKLPGEPIVRSHELYAYTMLNKNPESKILLRSQYSELANSTGDSCWLRLIAVDACTFDYEYIRGLGGPYYSYLNWGPFCLGEERKLVYYKKGNVTWGTPLIINNTRDISIDPKIKIYPNPARKKINIDLGSENYQHSLSVFIYDTQSRIKKTGYIHSGNTAIDVSDLSAGIYVLKITDNGRPLKIDKIVIE